VVLIAGGTYSYQVLSLVYSVCGPHNKLIAEVAVEMFLTNYTEADSDSTGQGTPCIYETQVFTLVSS
jgi:hypothetical protein